MKIVIDIPEEIIKDAKESPNYYPSYLFGTIWKSIGNGTVVNDDEWMKKADNIAKLHKRDALEDVRAEIEREADYQDAYVNADIAKGMYLALDIIDKHTKGEK